MGMSLNDHAHFSFLRSDQVNRSIFLILSVAMFLVGCNQPQQQNDRSQYPGHWFSAIEDPNKPAWEILPQDAGPGEVIVSKRNELGLLSNFAPAPFVFRGKQYASLEGFWQMMLYPEGPGDPRSKAPGLVWKYTRDQVAQMTAFDAKSAGTLAEENMKKMGIDWATFEGEQFPYRSAQPGKHYQLIVEAMRAKVEQNPEVKRVLLATGDLILKPDHHGEPDPPPEWKYCDVLMQIRSELKRAGG
jgi:predicted NAD-dependent protein-ADP-ribosyltransferase YbiA (DUF1768 family)